MATNNAINTGNPIGVAQGGTGAATLTAHGLLLGEGTSAISAMSAGTAGQIPVSGGASADPGYVTPTSTLATLTVTTNASTLNYDLPTTAVTAGSYTNTNLTVDAYGRLTAASNGSGGGGGTTWNDTTGGSATLAASNGYVADSASLTTFTLPASAALGDTYIIQGKGAGGWTIAQNSGQTIQLGSSVTTSGTGGSLSSTNQWDSITITCVTANNVFACRGVQGRITVV